MINLDQSWLGFFLIHINFPRLFFMFNTLSFLYKYSFTTIRPDFMDSSHFIHLSFIIPVQWFNYFIDTTIQPKCMVLFHLFCLLLCTTIRLKIRVLIINLFQLHVHDISTKTYDPHTFDFFFLRSSTISFFH